MPTGLAIALIMPLFIMAGGLLKLVVDVNILKHEMRTNGGSSLKDALLKVNVQLQEHIKHHNKEW